MKVVAQPVEIGIKRGPATWNYIYIALPIVLGIAIAVISVLDIPGLAKAVAIICASIIIIVAMLDSKHAHNWLLRMKSAYEDKVRY